MREKVALIAKIRALESAPRVRVKYVDPTETSGIGLLGEMSVAELKERLSILKVQEKEEQQRKRNEILQSKVVRDRSVNHGKAGPCFIRPFFESYCLSFPGKISYITMV